MEIAGWQAKNEHEAQIRLWIDSAKVQVIKDSRLIDKVNLYKFLLPPVGLI